MTLDGIAASLTLFQVLGVYPFLGQAFGADAEEPGAALRQFCRTTRGAIASRATLLSWDAA
jgi:hypothetical protein